MRNKAFRRGTLVVAALFIMSGVAQAELEYIPKTDKLFLAIGCNAAATGTCNTTEYWLGKEAGQNSVGAIPQTVTPWNYALSAAGTDVPFGPFPANETVPASYTIRTDQTIKGQVVLRGSSGPYASLDSTVSVELTAENADPRGEAPFFPRVSVNKTVTAGTGATNVYSFEIPWPAELADKTVINNLNVTLYVKGVHVLTSGFVDGQGGSFLNLPYYEVVESALASASALAP